MFQVVPPVYDEHLTARIGERTAFDRRANPSRTGQERPGQGSALHQLIREQDLDSDHYLLRAVQRLLVAVFFLGSCNYRRLKTGLTYEGRWWPGERDDAVCYMECLAMYMGLWLLWCVALDLFRHRGVAIYNFLAAQGRGGWKLADSMLSWLRYLNLIWIDRLGAMLQHPESFDRLGLPRLTNVDLLSGSRLTNKVKRSLEGGEWAKNDGKRLINNSDAIFIVINLHITNYCKANGFNPGKMDRGSWKKDSDKVCPRKVADWINAHDVLTDGRGEVTGKRLVHTLPPSIINDAEGLCVGTSFAPEGDFNLRKIRPNPQQQWQSRNFDSVARDAYPENNRILTDGSAAHAFLEERSAVARASLGGYGGLGDRGAAYDSEYGANVRSINAYGEQGGGGGYGGSKALTTGFEGAQPAWAQQHDLQNMDPNAPQVVQRYVATRRSKEAPDPTKPRPNRFVEMATDDQAVTSTGMAHSTEPGNINRLRSYAVLAELGATYKMQEWSSNLKLWMHATILAGGVDLVRHLRFMSSEWHPLNVPQDFMYHYPTIVQYARKLIEETTNMSIKEQLKERQWGGQQSAKLFPLPGLLTVGMTANGEMEPASARLLRTYDTALSSLSAVPGVDVLRKEFEKLHRRYLEMEHYINIRRYTAGHQGAANREYICHRYVSFGESRGLQGIQNTHGPNQPSDAMLVLHMFSTYMDHAMSTQFVEEPTAKPAAQPAVAASTGAFGSLFGPAGGAATNTFGGGAAFGGNTHSNTAAAAAQNQVLRTPFSDDYLAHDIEHVAQQVTMLVCQEDPLHVKVVVRGTGSVMAHWDVMHGPNNVYEAISLFLVYCQFAFGGVLRNVKLNHPSTGRLLESVAFGQMKLNRRREINFGIQDPFEKLSWLVNVGKDATKYKNRPEFNGKELLPVGTTTDHMARHAG